MDPSKNIAKQPFAAKLNTTNSILLTYMICY